jgi:hypothetical protein
MSATAAAFVENGHGGPMPARHQLRGSDRSGARPAFRPPTRRGILTGMSTRPRSTAGPPMTLGNMRANGVRSLDVSCHLCHHEAVLSADPWPDHVPVPSFGPRHPLRNHRCRRPAELARATRAGEPDRRAMAPSPRASAPNSTGRSACRPESPKQRRTPAEREGTAGAR